MNHKSEFFKYVLPSIIAFAMSGIYAIVDGYFVGNTIGDAGLSAINIAYPIVAVLQALGTGIGMGGAVYYSINMAEKKQKRARDFIATSRWLLILISIVVTVIIHFEASDMLSLLGAEGVILDNATDYIKVIALGAILQVLGTGLIPFMRNYGGSFWSMFAMMGGFVTNIILDFIMVWIYGWGMKGAAAATIISQGVTVAIAIIYELCMKKFYVKVSLSEAKKICGPIFKVGLAPFGLALTPNISLVFINRFSASYGGEKAIATYACVSYIICIIYLILQGVGDGSQPLMSRYYGENDKASLKGIQFLALEKIFLFFRRLLSLARRRGQMLLQERRRLALQAAQIQSLPPRRTKAPCTAEDCPEEPRRLPFPKRLCFCCCRQVFSDFPFLSRRRLLQAFFLVFCTRKRPGRFSCKGQAG